MFDLSKIQAAIREFGFDGWLFYDFRGANVLARRILQIPSESMGSRRFFYLVPANGEPQKLVHRIESGALDHLPGEKRIYLRWQELQNALGEMVGRLKNVAMEYSPNNSIPYISKVDCGTVELVRSTGANVESSGNLVQLFEAMWTDAQWRMHQEVSEFTKTAFEKAWKFIADSVRANGSVRETAVQQTILDFFNANDLIWDHGPIVGEGPNSGDPHYEPQVGHDAEIKENSFVLIDLWAKLPRENAVYSDLTKTGFVGNRVPEKYEKIFQIVAAARDAAIQFARDAFSQKQTIQGWQIDDVCRNVIEDAGYGEFFVHRTGHNIGQEIHGNGANIDNLETHDERQILPGTCFSIEPGIYLEEFGVRSEVDVFVDRDGQVHVTGGLQTSVLPILEAYS
ncbi:MAG: M24 family metallopeptidase [Pirellulales bacterium]|nr:M24 family metallopeptidase [Pirellulales bacterium]